MSVRTTSRVVRRRLALWSLLPVLALTASCGGGEDESADPGGASESSESSESSDSASPSGDQPYDRDSIIPAMEEAFGDATSSRIQMEMTGPAEMSMDGRMQMAERFEDGEMEMTLEVQGQRLDLRLVDGLIYVSGPPATPQGKWLEVDPQDPQDPLAQQFAGITRSGDLNTTFSAFKAGLNDVEYVGEEEIDGETVDHYVFTVDAAKAAQAQGQAMPPGGPEEISYDVWLTEDDLMRRVSFALGPMEAVIDATEWGEPVEVDKPAAADIVKPQQQAG
jgi:hypothetical protein